MRHRHALYRGDQVRELDRQAIEGLGIAGGELMRRAGQAAFRVLRARWPEARSVTICCGHGNNGGDGYVVADLARAAGLEVQVLASAPPDAAASDAAAAWSTWKAAGGTVQPATADVRGQLIVDALLGTGLNRPVGEPCAALIHAINTSGLPVLALDVPSGLNADTGMPMGLAVRADATVTFVAHKRGLFTGQAGDWCGSIVLDDLSLPSAVRDDITPDAIRWTMADVRRCLPPRKPSCHKGQLGHVLLIGGGHGMAGAVQLAARAALAGGSGRVTAATRHAQVAALAAACPEVMWQGTDEQPSGPWFEQFDAIAIGPGLGQDGWAQRLCEQVVAAAGPVVFDADGLNWLARTGGTRTQWVLTPHPGEAARLLDCTTADIQADRFAAARAIADQYRAICVLKGHGTLIAGADGPVVVCDNGTPAMASAGMGDALTGIIVSLIGQGLSEFDAACCGVLLHARAGERAALGRRCIRAGQLIEALSMELPA